MADEYLDYREIISEDDDSDDEKDDDKGRFAKEQAEQKLTKEQAFELLQEAVNMMVTEKGGKPAPISAVKIRMKTELLVTMDFTGLENARQRLKQKLLQRELLYLFLAMA